MDGKLKHLEFIQGVINRLSTNSFLLKGWSVVLISALFALSARDSEVQFVFLAYIPALAFWALDGYFLGLERQYRNLYESVRTRSPDDADFDMRVPQSGSGFLPWLNAVFSKTLLAFHGSLIAAVILVMGIQLRG